MSLSSEQLRNYIVIPTLKHLDPEIPYSAAAVNLVMGTAAQESGLRWLDQNDPGGRPGPGYGLWQMERGTHDDIWLHWIGRTAAIHTKVTQLLAPVPSKIEQLRTN